MDGITHNDDERRSQGRAEARSEGSSAPHFGVRPTFGLARDQGKRVEISFALKNGAMITAVDELGEALSAETVANYGEQLASDVSRGTRRTFRDGWAASGQYVWVDLGEVAAFSLRPAK